MPVPSVVPEVTMWWMALSLTLAAGEGPEDAPRRADAAVATPPPPPVAAQPQVIGSRTVVAPPETKSALRLDGAARDRVRLLEIESELGSLLVRPSAGEVFLGNLRKIAPWMGLGLIPLAGGLVLGLGGQNVHLTIPLSTEQAIVYPVVGIGGFVLAGLLVALFSVVSHFVEEADAAPARQQRIDALGLERAELNVAVR